MPLKLLIVKLIGNNITKHSKFNFTTIAPTRCKSEYDDPARATYSKSCLSDTFEFKFKQKVKKSKIWTYIICHYKRGGDKPKDLDPIQWEELKSQDHDTWKALSGQL